MATRYLFQKDHYFQVHHCEFTTYTTTDGETLGSVVAEWSPTGSYGVQFDSIVDAMNKYLIAPFPNNPRQWYYDSNTFMVTAEVLSSKICGSYAKNDFAKAPTKSEINKFEQGKQELYIVQFSMALQEVDIQDISAASAKAEGIVTL